MSERYDGAQGSALQELLLSVGNKATEIVRMRDFLGRKVARAEMDRLGMSGVLDETGDAGLEDLFGTCATTGIVLGMRKSFGEADRERQVQRLRDELPLPPSLAGPISKLIPTMVRSGVEFYVTELNKNSTLYEPSQRAEEWVEEFNLLRSSEP